jgi:predicted PurR-regulated permease PerM
MIYIIAHQLEGNVIQPLVVARTTELHPAAVAVGVVAASYHQTVCRCCQPR